MLIILFKISSWVFFISEMPSLKPPSPLKNQAMKATTSLIHNSVSKATSNSMKIRKEDSETINAYFNTGINLMTKIVEEATKDAEEKLLLSICFIFQEFIKNLNLNTSICKKIMNHYPRRTISFPRLSMLKITLNQNIKEIQNDLFHKFLTHISSGPHGNLTELRLDGVTHTNCAAQISSTCPMLTSLTLESTKLLDVTDEEIFPLTKLKDLQHLCLFTFLDCSEHLTGKGIADLITSLPKLHYLDVGEDLLKLGVMYLQDNLKKDQKFPLKKLVHVVGKNSDLLEYSLQIFPDLQQILLPAPKATPKDIVAHLEPIANLNNLKYLRMFFVPDNAETYMLQFINNFPGNLTHLDLSWVDLYGQALILLSKKCPRIEYLSLSISEDNIKLATYKEIPKFKFLKHLELKQNFRRHLLSMLLKNQSIVKISLIRTGFSKTFVSKFTNDRIIQTIIESDLKHLDKVNLFTAEVPYTRGMFLELISKFDSLRNIGDVSSMESRSRSKLKDKITFNNWDVTLHSY